MNRTVKGLELAGELYVPLKHTNPAQMGWIWRRAFQGPIPCTTYLDKYFLGTLLCLHDLYGVSL